MRRLLALLITLHGLSGLAFGQSSPGQIDPGHTPALGPHFDPELAFDAPTDPQRWTREPAGLHAAFGSTDEIYFQSEVPAVGTGATAWEATGWKGERLNAIVLVWSPDDLQQVRVEPTDLTDARGNVLSRNNVRLQVVTFVQLSSTCNECHVRRGIILASMAAARPAGAARPVRHGREDREARLALPGHPEDR